MELIRVEDNEYFFNKDGSMLKDRCDWWRHIVGVGADETTHKLVA